jgi:histidinol dehydrogenase
MKIIRNANVNSPEVKRLANRDPSPDPKIETIVRSILADVRKNGLAAVNSYAKKLDGLKGNLKVTPAELNKAANLLDADTCVALRAAIVKVRDFHKYQLGKSWEFVGKDGEKLGARVRPLKRVGVYIPGGAGAYPSTVIMCVVPAQVAGVSEIVAVSPCPRGGLEPALAFTLRELGVSEIYKTGGAQAVGLLAYGAGSVKKVDKIVGPANVYAALAKKEVFGLVDIDMIAGPSEILVIADSSADPDWVAADLLSQAEHGSGYEAAICITDDLQTAKWIADCVNQQIESSSKKEALQKNIDNFGRIFVVKDMQTAVAISNQLAPEHLEIMTREARTLSLKIENAGAVFIGPWSSEPVGDYFAGPNHVLPTNGTARFSSPLGVYDFQKYMSIIEYSQKAILKHGKKIIAIAEKEGFIHHAEAVRKRL